MVEILCPHCDENNELEDGSYGLFDCPYCGDEFEWENHNGDLVDNSDPFSKEALLHQLKIAGIIVPLTVISMAVLLFLYILLLNFPEINPLKESMFWTFYLAIIAAPVWIPVSFIPSIIYLIRYCLKNLLDRWITLFVFFRIINMYGYQRVYPNTHCKVSDNQRVSGGSFHTLRTQSRRRTYQSPLPKPKWLNSKQPFVRLTPCSKQDSSTRQPASSPPFHPKFNQTLTEN